METNNGIEACHPKTRQQWRNWLKKNGQSKRVVCLILYHKGSPVKSIHYNDAIEEALCFGWIDSKANKRDSESFYLQFTPRKPKSNWSKINIVRAEKMIQKGLMTAYGQRLIDIATQTGMWPVTGME